MPRVVSRQWYHMWWEKAPKYKSYFPARVKGGPGFSASIFSLICMPTDISSKFSCHGLPHLEGHSLHQPTMRISWLPETRKVSEMIQSSLSSPNQVIWEFPFCHFWVSEDLALGRPLGVVFCPPTIPSSLTDDVPLVRGRPPRPYCFRKPFAEIERTVGFPLPYWPTATAWQHSIVKIKREITLTYVILHKGNLFRYLE